MLLASVDYYRPETLADAVEALSEDVVARPLAGGQSLISLLKLRATKVDLLVDISRLEELRFVDVRDDGSVEIGAGVTYDELGRDAALGAVHPKLSEVAAHAVDAQVRNKGTIGGNICHNDPINDFPPLVLALDATMHVTGSGGDRDIPAGEFFTGYFATAVQPGEVLKSITIPPLDGYSVGYYDVEIGEAAARSVAVVKAQNGTIEDARVVLGCLPVPARRPEAEAELRGVSTDAEAIGRATASVAQGLDFLSDADASAEYRAAIAPVVAKRAVMQAIEGGSRHG